MRWGFEHLTEDAFSQDIWCDSIFTTFGLTIIGVRALEWKIVTGEHVILQMHGNESRLQDGFKLLWHILSILTALLTFVVTSGCICRVGVLLTTMRALRMATLPVTLFLARLMLLLLLMGLLLLLLLLCCCSLGLRIVMLLLLLHLLVILLLLMLLLLLLKEILLLLLLKLLLLLLLLLLRRHSLLLLKLLLLLLSCLTSSVISRIHI